MKMASGLSYLLVPQEIASLKSIEQIIAEQTFLDKKRVEQQLWLEADAFLHEEELHYHAVILSHMLEAAEEKMLELKHDRMLEELNDKLLSRVLLAHAYAGTVADVGLYVDNNKVHDHAMSVLDAEIAALRRHIVALVDKIAEKTEAHMPLLLQQRDEAINEKLNDLMINFIEHRLQYIVDIEHSQQDGPKQIAQRKALIDTQYNRIEEVLATRDEANSHIQLNSRELVAKQKKLEFAKSELKIYRFNVKYRQELEESIEELSSDIIDLNSYIDADIDVILKSDVEVATTQNNIKLLEAEVNRINAHSKIDVRQLYSNLINDAVAYAREIGITEQKNVYTALDKLLQPERSAIADEMKSLIAKQKEQAERKSENKNIVTGLTNTNRPS